MKDPDTLTELSLTLTILESISNRAKPVSFYFDFSLILAS